MIYTINFFPKHNDLTSQQHETLIQSYMKWLNTFGDSEELYDWIHGKYSFNLGPNMVSPYDWPIEVGVDIYDEETALAFKLKFGL